MRLWSIHPSYLDRHGLLAVWREALLAKKVLLGKTRGYRHHPQLERFKKHTQPILAINYYLYYIYREAQKRNYLFEKKKAGAFVKNIALIKVSRGQVDFEINHLKKKLRRRDKTCLLQILRTRKIKLHPLFKLKDGGIEQWEKL